MEMSCSQSEEIVAKIEEAEGLDHKLLIMYELADQQYTIDYDNLYELTNPQGWGRYYKQYNNSIHFFDLSNSDLNHIMGICAFLYYEEPPISKRCADYDPCLDMGFAINDNWGIIPELQHYSCFEQCRYILKLLTEMGYARSYVLRIDHYQDCWEQKLKEASRECDCEIWPQYSKREPGTIGLFTVDRGFLKDKLLISKIDCYFDSLYSDRQAILDNPASQTLFFDNDGFKDPKFYFLQNHTDQVYISTTTGTFGGHYKLKIYGRLDCPSAARFIAKGQYVRHRVFFEDEETAIAAGYRPCGVCMKEEYRKWKESKNKD